MSNTFVIQFNSYLNPEVYIMIFLIFLFYQGGKVRQRKAEGVPQVTELVNGWAGIQIQAGGLQRHHLY